MHNIVYAMQIIEATQKALGHSGKQDDSCLLCHAGIEEKKVPFGGVSFPHGLHVNGSCLQCHASYADHGKTVLKGCSDCHHGEGAGKVQCSDCHADKEAMFRGKAVKGTHGTPDAMWSKVSCVACHKAAKQGKKESVASIEAACVGCHGKGYNGLVRDWVAGNEAARRKCAASLAGFQEELSALEKQSGRHSVRLRARYDEMDEKAHLLLNGGLYHNPPYAEALAAGIDKDAAALRAMMNEQKAGRAIVPKE